ncbi:MAG: TIGR02391 family protein [Bifidobacteriaceae bacterium]|nr:TIGR02391 family protein [Bifidobacteriaceae bacterium]
MSGIDVRWATQEIDAFLHVTDQVVPDSSGGMVYLGTVMRGSGKEASERAYVVEQILDQLWGQSWRADKPSQDTEWSRLRDQASRGKTALLRQQEIREKLGNGAPDMDAGKLHPWAWETGSSLWRSSHFNQAVMAAATRVNAEAQAKLGRMDVSETRLFNEAFNTDPPKAGCPRLRIVPDDGSQTYRDIHRGARAFAEGIYAALRNPTAHQVATPGDEHLALEHLAAFSILARWIDEATVETV